MLLKIYKKSPGYLIDKNDTSYPLILKECVYKNISQFMF